MFEIGWSELAIIALVALVALGPKELPQAMKSFAAFTRKMQRYAREFRSGVDNIIREAELEDAKKALDTVRMNPRKVIQKVVDPTGETLDEVASVEAAAKDRGEGKLAPVKKAEAAKIEAPKAEGEAEAPPPAPKLAPVIVQPTNIAPPHSLRPPGPAPAPEPVPVERGEAAKPAAGDSEKA